jgi:hypothetical protein
MVRTFSSSRGDRGVVRRVVPGSQYNAPPSRPNVLTGESLFFRSEEEERSTHLSCHLSRWWERSAWRMRAPVLRLGSSPLREILRHQG